MISTDKEPNEKSMAAVIVSSIEIFMARIFNVPNGNEPRKLTSIPVKKIFSNGCIKRKYEEKTESREVGKSERHFKMKNSSYGLPVFGLSDF
jgi:hypothetical protein